jgi:hypothetical protein
VMFTEFTALNRRALPAIQWKTAKSRVSRFAERSRHAQT